MITIEINNKSYVVPTQFKEMSLGVYQEIYSIEVKSEKERIIEYLTIITKLDKKIVERISIDDLIKLMNVLDFFTSKNNQQLIPAFNIDETTYVFDNNLQKMRFDMFIDLEELTKEKDLIIENLHLIMAILYRPLLEKRKGVLIPEEYNSDNVIERGDFFKKSMMMDKVLGALFFFINLNLQYIQDLEVYLKKRKKFKMKTIFKRKQKPIIKNGVGY